MTAKYVARIAAVAVACALATMWLGWAGLPAVGFIYGVADRHARARGSTAALGAALGWAAILAAETARGADVRAVAEQVGPVLRIPGSVLIVITLVFAALLCGPAAVLGAAVGRFVSTRLAPPNRRLDRQP